jgi:hypothetical protein
MMKSSGPSLYALGLTDEQIHRFARSMFEPVITQPLSQVSMSELMMTGDDVVRHATGESPPRRSWRDRRNMRREAAKAYHAASAAGTFELPTMRMGFLSMKQLVYLERYGRMYIPEETLLGSPEFLSMALGDGPPAKSQESRPPPAAEALR